MRNGLWILAIAFAIGLSACRSGGEFEGIEDCDTIGTPDVSGWDNNQPPICNPALNCGNRECGPNGCGGQCGYCNNDQVCTAYGQCTTTTLSCWETGCHEGYHCADNGQCVPDSTGCEPKCSGKQCGNDGCGGLCGTCGLDYTCVQGDCVFSGCQAQCSGKQCGPDGCGGLCGTCPSGSFCNNGDCMNSAVCTPANCPNGTCVNGVCVPNGCVPVCGGKDCGNDGCGGLCGMCSSEEICLQGYCQYNGCTSNCNGRECGPDSCGGSCGTCGVDEVCSYYGQCVYNGNTGCTSSYDCPSSQVCSGGNCVPVSQPANVEICSTKPLTARLMKADSTKVDFTFNGNDTCVGFVQSEQWTGGYVLMAVINNGTVEALVYFKDWTTNKKRVSNRPWNPASMPEPGDYNPACIGGSEEATFYIVPPYDGAILTWGCPAG